MLSQFAIEEIEKAEREGGFHFTPREVVRLNALGLKVERSESAAMIYALPRVAFLGDEIVLREPTLGHEIWLDEVAAVVDMSDPSTSLTVTAFACSHTDPDELPNPVSKTGVFAAVKAFELKLRKFTAAQVTAATRYATEGRDAAYGEYPVEWKEDGGIRMDESFSVAVGVMRNGVAVCSGLSVGDAIRMTRAAVERMTERAYELRGVSLSKDLKNMHTGEFYATLDDIVAKHAKPEASNG